MSYNSKDSKYKSVRGYDSRNKSNPTKPDTNTIRVREKHWEGFERIKSETNISFNGFVSDLMEKHFKSHDFKIDFPEISRGFGLEGYLTLIGSEIQGKSARECLLAWLKNSKVPPFDVSKKTIELYRFLDTLPRSKEIIEFILDGSRNTLKLVQEAYDYELAKHLNLYKTLTIAAGAHQDDSPEREWILEQINYLINMEDMMINNYCMISANIRFAAYNCWKHNVMRESIVPAAWRAPYRDELIAMNRPLVEIRDGRPIHV